MSRKAIWKPSLKFTVEIQVLPGIKEGLGTPHWPDVLQKDHEDQVHEVDVDHEDRVDDDQDDEKVYCTKCNKAYGNNEEHVRWVSDQHWLDLECGGIDADNIHVCLIILSRQ